MNRLHERARAGWMAGWLMVVMTGVVAAANRDTRRFQELLVSEWDYTMEQSPDWGSQLGDRRWNDRWPDVSLRAFDARAAHASNALARLGEVRRTRLSAGDQLNFDLLEYDVVLGTGAVPLHIVERTVEAWIRSRPARRAGAGVSR